MSDFYRRLQAIQVNPTTDRISSKFAVKNVLKHPDVVCFIGLRGVYPVNPQSTEQPAKRLVQVCTAQTQFFLRMA